MIFKHSLKSIVRSPGKSLLFILLLSAAIIFVSLGSSMLFSANGMLDQADQQFHTVVSLKYGGLHDERGAWADTAFQETFNSLNLPALVDHSAVLSFDLEREIFAYAGDSTDIVQRNSPFAYVNVFTFLPRFQDEGGVWTVVSDKSIFGDEVGEKILVKINPLTTEGESVAPFEEGHTYLAATRINFVNNTRYATLIRPADLTNQTPEGLDKFAEFTDITDQPGFFDSSDWRIWQNLILSMEVIDQSFSVTVSSSLPTAAPFHLNQTWLTEGSFEISNGLTTNADICYISDRVASLLNLDVGDLWPLKFHYATSGNPAYSYWEEDGFAYEGDIRVAGIFNEVPGLAFTVYMPFPSWVNKAPDSYEFLRVLVDNKEVKSYVDTIRPMLPDVVGVTVEDQGYAAAIKPILTLQKQAITLTTVSAVAGIAVAILFSYLFISRQRETAQIMMMMGTGRTRTGAYLLYGILLIALIATIVGTLVAGAFDFRITEVVWDSLQKAPVQDMRYSERALGIPIAFNPEITTAAWVRWLSGGLLVLVILLITLIFALATLRQPKRKKTKEEISGPEVKAGKGIAFAYIPTVSLRFALRSIQRNFLRSLIVPAAALLMAAFIVMIGIAAHQQQVEAVNVYDEIPTTAYMTTFLGYSKEVPLSLQSDIFELLDPEYLARGFRKMNREPMSSEEMLALRESMVESNPYVSELMLTTKMHYTYMGVTFDANGNRINPEIPRRPEIPKHSNSYGYDWFEDKVLHMPTLFFTDNLKILPEFSEMQESDLVWLPGYDNTTFKTTDYIAVLPDRFAEENGIALGQKVRLAAYLTIQDQGVLMEAYDFKVVGTYAQGSMPPVVYIPWSLITKIPITFDFLYAEFLPVQNENGVYVIVRSGPYDPHIVLPDLPTTLSPNTEEPNAAEAPDLEIPDEYRLSNEVLADNVNSATFLLEDTRNLSDFRDYLAEHDYSQVGSINRNRLAVVIKDQTLYDAIENIQRHIAFMDLIRPVMLALSTLIGFILSYLLTRHRLHEFAVMRSLGTKRFGVYSAFFLEQLLLFLLGVVPVLVTLIIRPDWAQYVGLNLLWFVLLYALGIMVAIYIMGRSKILDILFTKE